MNQSKANVGSNMPVTMAPNALNNIYRAVHMLDDTWHCDYSIENGVERLLVSHMASPKQILTITAATDFIYIELTLISLSKPHPATHTLTILGDTGLVRYHDGEIKTRCVPGPETRAYDIVRFLNEEVFSEQTEGFEYLIDKVGEIEFPKEGYRQLHSFRADYQGEPHTIAIYEQDGDTYISLEDEGIQSFSTGVQQRYFDYKYSEAERVVREVESLISIMQDEQALFDGLDEAMRRGTLRYTSKFPPKPSGNNDDIPF